MSNKKISKKITNKLIVLSAPSGSGKTTLTSMLIKSKAPFFKLSVSYTTRAPRGAEKDGMHYFFITEDKFLQMKNENAFLEHAHVFGKHWYGTSKAFVQKALAEGKNVLFDIDVQGAQQIKAAYGKQCVSIFVHPPSLEELEIRLRKRNTENEAAIAARLKTATDEIAKAPSFDYQLTNLDIHETYQELVKILKKEQCIP